MPEPPQSSGNFFCRLWKTLEKSYGQATVRLLERDTKS